MQSSPRQKNLVSLSFRNRIPVFGTDLDSEHTAAWKEKERRREARSQRKLDAKKVKYLRGIAQHAKGKGRDEADVQREVEYCSRFWDERTVCPPSTDSEIRRAAFDPDD